MKRGVLSNIGADVYRPEAGAPVVGGKRIGLWNWFWPRNGEGDLRRDRTYQDFEGFKVINLT